MTFNENCKHAGHTQVMRIAKLKHYQCQKCQKIVTTIKLHFGFACTQCGSTDFKLMWELNEIHSNDRANDADVQLLNAVIVQSYLIRPDTRVTCGQSDELTLFGLQQANDCPNQTYRAHVQVQLPSVVHVHLVVCDNAVDLPCFLLNRVCVYYHTTLARLSGCVFLSRKYSRDIYSAVIDH